MDMKTAEGEGIVFILPVQSGIAKTLTCRDA